MLEFNNKQIETDKQGYLLDANDWSDVQCEKARLLLFDVPKRQV